MMTILFAIKDTIWQPFCFQNKDTITIGQAFLSICFCANLKNFVVILIFIKYLPFPDHCYMLVPSNSLANVEKRFKKP